MQSAASIALPMVGALVERAARRVGSRMVAYDDVGRTIGESGSWVRKFLGRQPVRLDADTWEAIKHRYGQECERWESEAALQKARFFALGRQDNAMGTGTSRRMDVDASRSVSRRGQAAAVVASMVDEGRE